MATDFRISGAASNPRSECDIRINPLNTQQIIAASNNINASNQAQFASSDGGATWSQSTLALQTGESLHSDPAVDWTSDGTAWAATLGINASTTVLGLRTFTSTDGGVTWTFEATPSGTQTNVDREIMWVDHSPSSPYRDQIYLTWHTGTPVQFVRRTTGSGAAWQTPLQVSGSETTGLGIGGDVKSNANGDVFVFWQDADGSQGIYLAKSTDGGVTFGSPITVATIRSNSRKLAIPADNGRKARVYVSAAVYRTASKDLAYVVYADLSGESGCTTGSGPGSDVTSSCKTRVWFTRSTDGGATWSSPTMLNNQSGKNDQAFPRIAVDETDGSLMVVYYDTVNDTARLKTELFMQTSQDDGLTWTAASKVSSGQTDETVSTANSGNQYGDYIGLHGHAGTFFPAWTDRRNGANEEIWSAKLAVVTQGATFLVERSTIGQDEVDARRGTAGGPRIANAFRLVVDGFTAAELGLTSATDTVAVTGSIPGMNVIGTGNVSTLGNYGPAVQRFTFQYMLDFGLDDTAFGFTTDTRMVPLAATVNGVTALAEIELIKQPNPFILHGDPPWLSIDLRVFRIRAGINRFGTTMGADATAAPAFIQTAIANLSAGTAGGDTFEGLDPSEAGSALALTPTDPDGTAVFNFAIARVRYIGLIGAADVRLFFRLFQAQTTSAAYDQSTTYRRAASNAVGQPIALAGVRGGEYVTIPCFATPRVDTTTTSMTEQADEPNRQTFTASAGGAEVDRYYGCWLDINQPTRPGGGANNVLPLSVPTAVDGPFTDAANPPVPIQQAILRSQHQCLIAEIAFDPVAIPAGKDPGNWDKLAQRNLAWSSVPNPGVDGSRTALDAFEVRATPPRLPATFLPDEVMIDWGRVPAGTTAQVYFPALDAASIVETATKRYVNHRLSVLDPHTIEVPAGGLTYLPIPSGDEHWAGLLSVDLPAGIRRGEQHSVLVRQVTTTYGVGRTTKPPVGRRQESTAATRLDVAEPADLDAAVALATTAGASTHEGRRVFFYRKVLGAFELAIPVRTKAELLVPEERSLAVLRWIADAVPVGNRWYPVLRRYVGFVGGRVTGLGGDPGRIEPSPTGGRPGYEPGEPGEPGAGWPGGAWPGGAWPGGSWPGGGGYPGRDWHGEIGKVVGVDYDRWGDFVGFQLDTWRGVHGYSSREPGIEIVVRDAWRRRILVQVFSDRKNRASLHGVVLLGPPLERGRRDD